MRPSAKIVDSVWTQSRQGRGKIVPANANRLRKNSITQWLRRSPVKPSVVNYRPTAARNGPVNYNRRLGDVGGNSLYRRQDSGRGSSGDQIRIPLARTHYGLGPCDGIVTGG